MTRATGSCHSPRLSSNLCGQHRIRTRRHSHRWNNVGDCSFARRDLSVADSRHTALRCRRSEARLDAADRREGQGEKGRKRRRRHRWSSGEQSINNKYRRIRPCCTVIVTDVSPVLDATAVTTVAEPPPSAGWRPSEVHDDRRHSDVDGGVLPRGPTVLSSAALERLRLVMAA